MSFPRLILEKSSKSATGFGVITNIELVYDNPVSNRLPTRLQRQDYRITREIRPKNVSQQVPKRHQNISYDQYRETHTWVGFADVMTFSIIEKGGTSTETTTTIELLKNAIIYQPGTGGIEFTTASPVSKGQANPSSNISIGEAIETPSNWIYKVEDNVEVEVPYWLIKEVSIKDNGNATSRVTFTFTITTAWNSLKTMIDAFNS